MDMMLGDLKIFGISLVVKEIQLLLETGTKLALAPSILRNMEIVSLQICREDQGGSFDVGLSFIHYVFFEIDKIQTFHISYYSYNDKNIIMIKYDTFLQLLLYNFGGH